MASMSDLDQLLQAIMREATAAVAAESCSLALYDEGKDELYFYVARGENEERDFERQLKCVRLKPGTGIVGWCLARRLPVNIADAYADARFDPSADRKTGFVTRSILAVPLAYRGRLVGVVEAVNKVGGGAFSERDVSVLSVLAAQATMVLENARLYQENLHQARLTALGQGIAGAAHCIKNILNGIDGGAYILQAGLGRRDLEGAAKGWDILGRNLTQMKGLVLDMLAYAKPRLPEIEPCDINGLCQDMADTMRDRARTASAAISVDLDPGVGIVLLDPKGIYRCLLNLVGNAIDALEKPGGVVGIATRRGPGAEAFELHVSDTGCGISEENRRNLFRVFFSTKGSRGTGLGLAVTRKIVNEHGGELRVDSELGVGTTFVVSLPLRRPPGGAAATPAASLDVAANPTA